jgi:chromosome segregation ATPase
MDYTTQEQQIDAGISARQSTIAQASGELAALQAAKDVITTGYQSDVTAIATAVASRVGDIKTENATLTTQVQTLNDENATLTAQATTDATTIATLQEKISQIQTILTDGSGSDNQIQEITTLINS